MRASKSPNWGSIHPAWPLLAASCSLQPFCMRLVGSTSEEVFCTSITSNFWICTPVEGADENLNGVCSMASAWMRARQAQWAFRNPKAQRHWHAACGRSRPYQCSLAPQRRVRTVYIVMEPININQCDSQTEPRRQGPNWLHPIDTEKAKDQTTSKRESLSRRPQRWLPPSSPPRSWGCRSSFVDITPRRDREEDDSEKSPRSHPRVINSDIWSISALNDRVTIVLLIDFQKQEV